MATIITQNSLQNGTPILTRHAVSRANMFYEAIYVFRHRTLTPKCPVSKVLISAVDDRNNYETATLFVWIWS